MSSLLDLTAPRFFSTVLYRTALYRKAAIVVMTLAALLTGCALRAPEQAPRDARNDSPALGEVYRPGEGLYHGELNDGKRAGRGILEGPEGIYEGEWANDLQQGFGELRGSAGSRYVGQWYAGLRQGSGSWSSAEGESYDGQWLNDKPHGTGIYRSADGTVYLGNWQDGLRSGNGREIRVSGVVYEGEWSDGQRQGFGREDRPDGSSYEGEWDTGTRHGTGTAIFADGSRYEGSWERDVTMGPGARRYDSGIEVRGLWQGERVSSGLLELPSGKTFAGPLTSRQGKAVTPLLFQWLEQTATAGDPHAQLLLASAWLGFEQPTPDQEQAKAWLARATPSSPEAAYRLAALMLQDPAPDTLHLLKLLTGAGSHGHAEAQRLLGDLFKSGTLVTRDLPRAAHWYRGALRAGSPLAAERLARTLLQSVLGDTASDPLLNCHRRVADSPADSRAGDDPPAALDEARDVLTWRAIEDEDWVSLATLARVEAVSGNWASAGSLAERALTALTPLAGALPRAARPIPAIPLSADGPWVTPAATLASNTIEALQAAAGCAVRMSDK
jgi:TPR repeat protein